MSKKKIKCVWRYSDPDGFWHTSCDNQHWFEDGGPTDNYHNFCPYCGHPIEIAIEIEEADHADLTDADRKLIERECPELVAIIDRGQYVPSHKDKIAIATAFLRVRREREAHKNDLLNAYNNGFQDGHNRAVAENQNRRKI